MKTLIIIKPSALAKKALGLIISRIEEKELVIVAVKAMGLDVHLLERKENEEKDTEKKQSINNARKIPCVLVIAEGENAINVGQSMKKEFGEMVHVSLNEETAKYEINRFFSGNEIFDSNKEDGNYFLIGKNHSDFLHKSIKQIASEAIKEKEN